jgi:hypothetical protein
VSGKPPPAATQALEPAARLPHRIAHAYRQHIDYRRKTALRLWLAFIATFAFLRGLTYGIRYHLLPFGNVVTGGIHIHHFVWGILLLLIVGFLGLNLEAPRWHPLLAIPFGIAAALVIDEFALWLNLQDVYWAREGRISVDVAILVASFFGLYYAADRFWKQVLREIRIVVRLVTTGERRLLRRRRPPRPR